MIVTMTNAFVVLSNGNYRWFLSESSFLTSEMGKEASLALSPVLHGHRKGYYQDAGRN